MKKPLETIELTTVPRKVCALMTALGVAGGLGLLISGKVKSFDKASGLVSKLTLLTPESDAARVSPITTVFAVMVTKE